MTNEQRSEEGTLTEDELERARAFAEKRTDYMTTSTKGDRDLVGRLLDRLAALEAAGALCGPDDVTVKRAELDEVLRVFDLLLSDEPDEQRGGPVGETVDSYGNHACGCSWDSGPYATHCQRHSPQVSADALIESLRAALGGRAGAVPAGESEQR